MTNTLLLPAFALPPDIVDPSGTIVAWWTDPPGVVMQLNRPTRGTATMAEWMVGPGFEQLVARFPGLTDLRVVLDMRQMTGRSALARSTLMQPAKLFAARVGHVVLIPSIHMGPAYIKVVEAAAILLRLVGMRVDIEQSVERALAKHGIQPALPAPLPAPLDPPFASRGL
jgi:hypothetical protein